jgi:hypothetical protein
VFNTDGGCRCCYCCIGCRCLQQSPALDPSRSRARHMQGKPVTVGYATADGTASAPEDYTAASGTLTFAPGETAKTVSVAVVGDTLVEGDETFSLVLSGPVNATLAGALATATATATISNDDVRGAFEGEGRRSLTSCPRVLRRLAQCLAWQDPTCFALRGSRCPLVVNAHASPAPTAHSLRHSPSARPLLQRAQAAQQTRAASWWLWPALRCGLGLGLQLQWCWYVCMHINVCMPCCCPAGPS